MYHFLAISAEMALNLKLKQCTPAPGLKYKDADTSPLQIDGKEVTITEKFEPLGNMPAKNLKDNAEMDARIRRAQGAFHYIRKQFFRVGAKGTKKLKECVQETLMKI